MNDRTSFTDDPVCPYCFRENPLEDEYPRDGDTEEIECCHCEKKFWRTTSISVDYSTVGDCELNGEMPHRLRVKYHVGNNTLYECATCLVPWYDWNLPGGQYPKLKEGEFILPPAKEDRDQLALLEDER